MRQNGMLLVRHTGRRAGRLHDGKVVVMRSNLRWCSVALRSPAGTAILSLGIRGDSEEAKKMARMIIEAQEKEIAEMTRMIEEEAAKK